MQRRVARDRSPATKKFRPGADSNLHFATAYAEARGFDRDTLLVARLAPDQFTLMQQIRAACDQALKQDGADVVILGCTCMQPVAALLERDGLPVIEPMTAGYRRLEALAGSAH